MRVIAAMSGGVDSAVAAARAVEAGHDVTGIHLALSRNPASYRSGARGCCTLEDAHDARRAADVIGIPFYVWDLSERFHEDVVEDFMDEYAAGRTPNPCLRCNEKIKFAAVLDRAIGLGFDAVATGHYAQLREAADGTVELHRAEDGGKDQSYVLGVLTQDQLRHSLFPLGDTPKPEVRREAERRGLRVADKPDSHDICFVADGDNAGWLREKLGDKAPNHGGEIVDDATGEVLGRHEGTYAFTIGQRKGLRIGRPAPDGKPRFVLDIEPVSGTVRVGPREALTVDRLEAGHGRWCGAPPQHLDGHGPAARPWRRAPRGGDDVRRRPPGGHRAARPRPGDRSRAGGGHVRRHARRRLGHHHGHPMTPAPMTLATGVGSLPGTDIAEAVRLVVGELPDLPHLPELPERGPGGEHDRPGARDRRGPERRPAAGGLAAGRPGSRARASTTAARAACSPRTSTILEEALQDYEGHLKVQVAGPWTLAATVERPRGDKVLADHGARRDLAQALAEGVRTHLADVRRRVPGAGPLVLQVDEPALAAVLTAQVPTASGFGRHRSVDRPELSEHLGWVFAAATESGAEPWAHSCAPGTPLDLIRGAGAKGLSVDFAVLSAADHDALGRGPGGRRRRGAGAGPVRGPRRAAHRRRPDRPRADLARPARPRPGGRLAAPARHPVVRPGGRLTRLGPPRAGAQPRGREEPLTVRDEDGAARGPGRVRRLDARPGPRDPTSVERRRS